MYHKDRASTPAERMRAMRLRRKLEKGDIQNIPKLKPGPQKQVTEQIEAFEPHYVDTREWTDQKWALTFLHIDLEHFQQNDLYNYRNRLRLIDNTPRRHGKTTIKIFVFVVRNLCETVFTKVDMRFIYFSQSRENVVDFIVLVADALMSEEIIENFGYLIDEDTEKEWKKLKALRMKKKLIRQTQYILDLTTRKQKFNHNLQGITIKGSPRGKGCDYAIIDDPVDVFHGQSESRKLTKKIISFIERKLIPMVERAILLVGTRYDLDGHDIYSILGMLLDGKVWKWISRKAVYKFGTYEVRDTEEEITPADIIIKDPDSWELLSERIWDIRAEPLRAAGFDITGLQYLVYLYHTMKRHAFMAEFQNEPIALEAVLHWDWLGSYSIIPKGLDIQMGVYVDIATGETKEADYSAISFVMLDKTNNAYVQDIIFGRWTGLKMQTQLENFVSVNAERADVNPRHVQVMIETIMGQRDFFQRIRDESWITPKPRQPGKRGEKKQRIKYGLGQEMENSKVFVFEHCRNKSQFKTEVEGFDQSDDDHILDCVDQNIFNLKKAGRKLPTPGRTTSTFEKR